MRKLNWICIGLVLCGLLVGIARAETFELNNGQTLSGVVVSANEKGLIVREGENKYSNRVPWTQFSQADLKKLAKNPKIASYVEPFIEVSQKERIKKTEVKIHTPPRLNRPPKQSLFGALFSSSVGLMVLLLLYAANFYAAYEIAIFRAQPLGLVCGVAAVAPVLGPIVFLALPTRIRRSDEEQDMEPAAPAPSFAVPGTPPPQEESASAPGGLRISRAEGGQAGSAPPPAQVFQRGAFTFNRRFFETKFAGFFGMVRREAEKDLVLVIKSARGEYVGQRITRIAANELHLHVQKGAASEEVTIPFTEIKEVQLKHKDA